MIKLKTAYLNRQAEIRYNPKLFLAITYKTMSELENTDVENLDEDYETDVDTNEQDESSDENLNSSKKNKSNWKEMSKALKGANAKIQALEAQLATKGANSEDLRLFFLENPEFKEYKNTIAELKSQDKYKYLDMSDLVELAKIKQPKPSVDSEDFNIVNKVKS